MSFDRAAVAGACVYLLRSCNTVRADEDGQLYRDLDHAGVPGRSDIARTDEHGQFRFDSFPCGTYCVLASWTPLLEAKVGNVSIDERTSERSIELVLPPHGYLHGRVLAPEGASFDHASLCARTVRRRPELYPLADLQQRDPESMYGSVATGGTFRVGPLPLELVDVSLDLGFRIVGCSGWGTNRFDVGRELIELDTANRAREYDARPMFPGRLRAHVTVNGAARDDIMLEATNAAGREHGTSSWYTDSNGDVELVNVKPGEYEIVVRPRIQNWFFHRASRVVVRRAETSAVSIEVKLSDGELTLRDATDEAPLAKQEVWIQTAGEEHLGLAVATTDDSGFLKLSLPPGRYTVRRKSYDDPPVNGAVVTWPPAQSTPLVVRIPQTKRF